MFSISCQSIFLADFQLSLSETSNILVIMCLEDNTWVYPAWGPFWPSCVWMPICLFSIDTGYFQLLCFISRGLQPSLRSVLESAVRSRLCALSPQRPIGAYSLWFCAGRTLLCLVGAGSESQAHQGPLLGLESSKPLPEARVSLTLPRSFGVWYWWKDGSQVGLLPSSHAQNCFQVCG